MAAEKTSEKLNLYQKMSKVMSEIEYLNKDDKIEFGSTKYKAISEEKVTMAVRLALIKYGLIILPIHQEHRKDGNLTTVDISYKIVNIDDPEEYEIIVSSGTGADSQDKGVGKAMTYAYKYLLLRTFAIPTGEDPDKISNAEIEDKAKKAALKAKSAPTAPTINTAQQKQLFAIANNKAKVVKDILIKHKLTQSKEVLVSDFDLVCKEIEEEMKKTT